MHRISLTATLCLTLLACGDEEDSKDDTGGLAGEAISCDWFDGDNCWKEHVVSAQACAIPDVTGTFNANFTICSFPDGTEVHFDTPAPVAGSPTEDDFFDYPWNFEIFVGGSSCLSYTTGEYSWSLETPDGSFDSLVSSGENQLTCPSGDQVVIGTMTIFSDCDWNSLPGYVAMSGAGMSFGLTGGAEDLTLFSCSPE